MKNAFYRALIAIETDATRYHGSSASQPRLLDCNQAEQMLAHLSADLGVLLPEIPGCSLIAPGALFDQTQILRPGFPVFTALESVVGGREEARFVPGLISIGAEDGTMPDANLQPQADIPLGLLKILPIALHGPAGLVEELAQTMEYRFLEEGQLSPKSAQWLQTAFGVSVNHARFMTLTDLNAMLRLQLEHFGFLPLWELLDAALSESPEILRVETPSGQVYEWKQGAVHTAFQSFDYWANCGGGASSSAERQQLAGGYGDWTREARQYLTTLRAHGVTMKFHRPGEAGERLDGTYFVEHSQARARPTDSSITEHSFGDLGTIAVTVAQDERLENYYPLSPDGLNDIHSQLRSTVKIDRTVSFPGNILYDERTRGLKPDPGPERRRH
ncbi:MAG: hypothetical protein RQ826_16105 [Xanthomonadales bacterium]|nr:hypothetical protein [Xanthomonadales bacterium]